MQNRKDWQHPTPDVQTIAVSTEAASFYAQMDGARFENGILSEIEPAEAARIVARDMYDHAIQREIATPCEPGNQG